MDNGRKAIADELQAVATEGVERLEIPHVRLGKGVIGQVASSGER